MDAPRRPHDQPREAMAAPMRRSHLAALAERLKGQFDIEPTDEGLVVCDRNRLGGTVTITCRNRPDDGGRSWFFASCSGPIAEVDRIPDTVVAIQGFLSGSRRSPDTIRRKSI